MASGPFKVPVYYSSVDYLLDECKKNKKLKTFFIEKDAKKIGDNLHLLPVYTVTNKKLGLDGKLQSFKKQRAIISFEGEYISYDVTPKKERKYEPFVVVSEYFNGSENLHYKSKLFELVQCAETYFKKEIEKFIKKDIYLIRIKRKEMRMQ